MLTEYRHIDIVGFVLRTYVTGMVEDRMDVDVARALLEANNWDLQRSVDQIFDNPGDGPAP